MITLERLTGLLNGRFGGLLRGGRHRERETDTTEGTRGPSWVLCCKGCRWFVWRSVPGPLGSIPICTHESVGERPTTQGVFTPDWCPVLATLDRTPRTAEVNAALVGAIPRDGSGSGDSKEAAYDQIGI